MATVLPFRRLFTSERATATEPRGSLLLLRADAHPHVDALFGAHVPLTPTERAIARDMAAGARDREIAAATGKALRTVHTHARAVLSKCDVSSRAELAARVAARSGVGATVTRPAARLTRRETEVAARVAVGRANKDIAFELGVSTSSVETWVARLRSKLGVPTRAALAALLAAAAERPPVT